MTKNLMHHYMSQASHEDSTEMNCSKIDRIAHDNDFSVVDETVFHDDTLTYRITIANTSYDNLRSFIIHVEKVIGSIENVYIMGAYSGHLILVLTPNVR